MTESAPTVLATAVLALAIVHSFLVSKFQSWSNIYPKNSIRHNILEMLSELEIVFGLWAGIFIILFSFSHGREASMHYLDNINFSEPIFVFIIMAVASTKPIALFAESSLALIANRVPVRNEISFYLIALIFGPLLGSLITEPAAMTLTASILLNRYFNQPVSMKFKYVTIAILFVNISIGGTLTHFAAPPVVMVARQWGLSIPIMFTHYGYKALVAIIINTLLAILYLRTEFSLFKSETHQKIIYPFWIKLVHLFTLVLLVIFAHHPAACAGVFLFFIGFVQITKPQQENLKLRESLLVAFFLGGLVVLGGLQSWWLQPLLKSLNELQLFVGATGLTAITDNAALTYLGSKVEGLSESMKYSLLAGAVVGGGLTVIANAPNPIGYSILQSRFGHNGFNPGKLFLAALVPTLIAMGCLWFLPNL